MQRYSPRLTPREIIDSWKKYRAGTHSVCELAMDMEILPRSLRAAWRRYGYRERRRWDATVVAQLGRRYKNGERLPDLAAEQDCSTHALYVQFIRHDIMQVQQPMWSQADLAYIGKMWREDKRTTAELATEYGVSQNAIKCLIKRNREICGFKRSGRTEWTPELLLWVQRELKNGSSTLGISESLGCSRNALSSALARAGIPVQRWRRWQLDHLAARCLSGEDLRKVAADNGLKINSLKTLFKRHQIKYAR